MLRKYLQIAALALVFCTGIFIRAYAGEAGITFSDPVVSLSAEDVNVTMKISSDDGTNLSDANVVLSYPQDRLEFISGTDSDGGAGAIRVHGSSNGSGTTVLEYNLRFRPLVAGTASITISNYEVYDTADAVVTINHQGSSTVTINADDQASNDASLSILEVSPGELSPSFSSDITSYTMTVGTSVNSLSINAGAADDSANISIANNSDFVMGENTVTVTVVAPDGQTTRDYTIVVSKVEGGPEVDVNEQTSTDGESETAAIEGVQLYSRRRTITVINPDDSVEIPEGFRSGTISIGEAQVKGWVPKGVDSEEYCVVYGINEDGQANFYRYDRKEGSIQRYFADPLAEGSVSGEEYDTLLASYESAVSGSGIRLIIIIIMGAVIFVLIIFSSYLLARNRSLRRSGNLIRVSPRDKVKRHRRSSEGSSETTDGDFGIEDSTNNDLLKHNFNAESNLEILDQAGDETQVIKRHKRRHKVSQNNSQEDETGLMDPEETTSGKVEESNANYDDTPTDAKANQWDSSSGSGDDSGLEDLDI